MGGYENMRCPEPRRTLTSGGRLMCRGSGAAMATEAEKARCGRRGARSSSPARVGLLVSARRAGRTRGRPLPRGVLRGNARKAGDATDLMRSNKSGRCRRAMDIAGPLLARCWVDLCQAKGWCHADRSRSCQTAGNSKFHLQRASDEREFSGRRERERISHPRCVRGELLQVSLPLQVAAIP